MQQFHSLPKFSKIEEAESVEIRPVDTGPMAMTGAFPRVSPRATGHIPVPPRVTGHMPAFPHTTGHMPVPPRATGHMPASPHTTGHMPVLLFTGPNPTGDTDRLAALTMKTATAPHASFSTALQATMN